MADFLRGDQPLWARLGYASEADYLEAQKRREKSAKESLGAEATRKYAAAGRDYDIIKRINKRIKKREGCRRYYWKDHARTLERNRARWRRNYYANPELYRAHSKRWRQQNREWCRQYGKWWRSSHLDDLRAYTRSYREQHHEEIKAKDQAYYEQHHEEIKRKVRVWYKQNQDRVRERERARRAEKLGLSLQEYMQRITKPKMTPEDRRAKNAARMREWRASLGEDELAAERARHMKIVNAYRARKRAEKLAQRDKAS